MNADAIRSLYDGGEYEPCVKAINSALGSKGQAAGGYDRYALNRLKSDALLRLRQPAAALAALGAAQEETNDAAERDDCAATILLIRASRDLTYTPHAALFEKPAPFDVTDPKSRPAAMKALLKDELERLGPAVKKASEASRLNPVYVALADVKSIVPLERAVNRNTAGSDTLIDTLRKSGLRLITHQLETIKRENLHVRERAVAMAPQPPPAGSRATVRVDIDRDPGPDAQNNERRLRDLQDQCKEAAELAERIADTMEDPKGQARQLVEYAEEILDSIQETLTNDTGMPAEGKPDTQ